MQDPVIVAKMYCSKISHTHAQYSATGAKIEQEEIELRAVYGKGEANKQWSKATPSGSLDLTISNPEAFGKAQPGYYKVLLVPCGEDD
jgi:hypothetical protein